MRGFGLVVMLLVGSAGGQLASRDGAATVAPQQVTRVRLYLKDGSFQIVTSYRVRGDRVRYVSAERDGQTEEIPLKLVDLAATEKWAREHTLGPDGQRPAPAIDPELLREEAEQAQIAPEVDAVGAPGLRLEPADDVLGLDTFRAAPELVPMVQVDGSVNRLTGHAEVKEAVNPLAAAHGVVVLKGEKADVQMHVNKPEFYVKLDDSQVESGGALTVDTHGASAAAGKGRTAVHAYVIVRVDVRQDARVVPSFEIAALDTDKRQEDVFETTGTVLPGGHWLKLVPEEGLLIGEYALVEVLGGRAINAGVWDFGVHPTAPENRDLIVAEKKRTGFGKR